ncbi:MAG TPA: 4-hydroxy-tetrahydrodipicolinate synthase [Phycisphaerae bacterium]|jgi:4-hydroxy-tetrahydrodipicolinate synthase
MVKLRGSMVALVTPFRSGEVDWPALERLVDRQIEAGTDVLVPCGTTGESPTLSHAEHDRVIEAVIARNARRKPVLAGTGSNCTAEAIRLTKHARDAGADAALLVAPYYNRPTQEGLFRHFAAIADAVELPLVLYNIPIRCGIEIKPETIARLRAAYPQYVAVKHATGSIDGASELAGMCDIDILSGDDSLTLPLMSVGAVGVVSVLANLIPSEVQALVDAAASADYERARGLHRKQFALYQAMAALGPNPLPIKTSLAMQGLIAEEFRLPLCPLSEDGRHKLENVLRKYEYL